MTPGAIYRDDAFYVDAQSGALKTKYFVVLAAPPKGDVVIRLLTSQASSRPEVPACNHGPPYPSYYLGVPGGRLGKKTWIDLRTCDDIDPIDATRRMQKALLHAEGHIAPAILRLAMACVAGAQDTTTHQEKLIRDALAALA